NLESGYYMVIDFIKEVMSDNSARRMIYGIPAIFLLLYALLGSVAWRVAIGLTGAFLLVKGFRLESFVDSMVGEVGQSLTKGKMSFFLYALSATFLVLGVVQGYNTYLLYPTSTELNALLASVGAGLAYYLISGLSFLTARLLFAKERHKRPFRYMTYYALLLSIYIVLENAISYVMAQGTLLRLLLAIIASFMILFISFITERIALSSQD
ncbi:MAG: DUF373 family protein, partial [Candidatus Aenigmatarchaeota archaeon]